MAAPMPWRAPVTMATLSCTSIMLSSCSAARHAPHEYGMFAGRHAVGDHRRAEGKGIGGEGRLLVATAWARRVPTDERAPFPPVPHALELFLQFRHRACLGRHGSPRTGPPGVPAARRASNSFSACWYSVRFCGVTSAPHS